MNAIVILPVSLLESPLGVAGGGGKVNMAEVESCTDFVYVSSLELEGSHQGRSPNGLRNSLSLVEGFKCGAKAPRPLFVFEISHRGVVSKSTALQYILYISLSTFDDDMNKCASS